MRHLNSYNNENILKLIDYSELETFSYIITEYCEGGDLNGTLFTLSILEYLKRNKTIPEDEAIHHLKEIL